MAELTHTLFRDSRGDQVAEGSWVALNMYLNRMPAFYRHAIEQLPLKSNWDDDDREFALLMTCRAMRMMASRKKLLHFAYRTVDADLWGHMNRVYARSKVFGLHRTLTEPYSGSGESTSVHNEYMAGMLFETARLGGVFASFETNKLMDDKYFNKIRFGSVSPDQTGKGKKEGPPPNKLSPKEVLETLETRGDKELLQRWIVLDTSDSGFGVLVPGRAPWAKLGVLIAYRLVDSLKWEVSIVRRLGRNAENKMTVGLERLAGAAKSARARQVHGAIPDTWENLTIGVDNSLEAVLIEGETKLMLLQPGRYGESDYFIVSSGTERYPVQVNGVLPPGSDYQILTYSRAGGYSG